MASALPGCRAFGKCSGRAEQKVSPDREKARSSQTTPHWYAHADLSVAGFARAHTESGRFFECWARQEIGDLDGSAWLRHYFCRHRRMRCRNVSLIRPQAYTPFRLWVLIACARPSYDDCAFLT